MLSHQNPNAHRQLRQHRRQQSTPTAFEQHHVTLSPATIQQDYHHRRGMSLIQPSSQDERQVGITNQGQKLQQFSQETHSHSKAPPGPSTQLAQHVQLSAEEFRILQHQQLDAHIDNLMKANQAAIYNTGQHYVKIERSRSNPEHQSGNPADQSNYSNKSSAGDGTLHVTELGQSRNNGRPTSSQGLSMIHDKSVSLATNSDVQPQRPYTPPNQSNFGYFPMTPATTPYTGGMVLLPRSSSPEDMDTSATIKPVHRALAPQPRPLSQIFNEENGHVGLDLNATIKPGAQLVIQQRLSCSDLFDNNAFDQLPPSLPSPPNTVPMRSRTFDVAAMPSQSELEALPVLNLSPTTQARSGASKHRRQRSAQTVSTHSSMPSSPELGSNRLSVFSEISMFGGTNMTMHDDSMDFELYGSPEGSPQMSIADLSLEGTVEDTGISAEEVQAYISEQDAADQKWTCLFPECGKKFGRRENIRSHIQTHLGDRQFKCIHCNKRFVRQHDLKRHSKIHSGVKPYPCRCGQSFARHDALTRHRQRNMCIGAFEGIVKKTVKRGRPRKHREGDEERIDKANETRKRAMAKSYASSVSCTSESSRDDSPTNFMVDGFEEVSNQMQLVPTLESNAAHYFPPGFFSYTPPTSPYSTGAVDSPKKSPKTLSQPQMPPSPAEGAESDKTIVDDAVLQNALSYESQVSSRVGSPPELSHSSPPSSTRLGDLDFGPLLNDQESQQNSDDYDMFNMHQHHDDLFESVWDGSPLLALEKESGAFRLDDHFNAGFNDDVLFSDNCEAGQDFM